MQRREKGVSEGANKQAQRARARTTHIFLLSELQLQLNLQKG
jgi:hypothetical protein